MVANAITLNARAESATPLRRVQPGGWRSGLGNLLRNELRPWISTRFGLIQVAIWLVVINGFLALPLWIAPLLDHSERADIEQHGGPYELGILLFFQLATYIAGIGVAVLAMGAIVGEKQSGTAAWVLSKPTSRMAFVVSKLIGLAAGAIAIAVALQSAVAFVHIGVASGHWPVRRCLPRAPPWPLCMCCSPWH